jgi:hypothetical protein
MRLLCSSQKRHHQLHHQHPLRLHEGCFPHSKIAAWLWAILTTQTIPRRGLTPTNTPHPILIFKLLFL